MKQPHPGYTISISLMTMMGLVLSQTDALVFAEPLGMTLQRSTHIPETGTPLNMILPNQRNAKIADQAVPDSAEMGDKLEELLAQISQMEAEHEGMKIQTARYSYFPTWRHNQYVQTWRIGSGGDQFSRHLRFIKRLMKEMVGRVKRLTRFNQKRGSSASFNLAMMGSENGGEGEGEASPTGTTEEIMGAEGDVDPIASAGLDSLGDVDGDGDFDLDDAVAINQIAFGVRDGTDAERARADLNQDGTVDKKDAMLAALLYTGVLTFDELLDPDFNMEALLTDEGYYYEQSYEIDPDGGGRQCETTGYRRFLS